MNESYEFPEGVYKIKRTNCDCHPETCCHWDFKIVNPEGKDTGISGDNATELGFTADELTAKRNNMLSDDLFEKIGKMSGGVVVNNFGSISLYLPKQEDRHNGFLKSGLTENDYTTYKSEREAWIALGKHQIENKKTSVFDLDYQGAPNSATGLLLAYLRFDDVLLKRMAPLILESGLRNDPTQILIEELNFRIEKCEFPDQDIKEVGLHNSGSHQKGTLKTHLTLNSWAEGDIDWSFANREILKMAGVDLPKVNKPR